MLFSYQDTFTISVSILPQPLALTLLNSLNFRLTKLFRITSINRPKKEVSLSNYLTVNKADILNLYKKSTEQYWYYNTKVLELQSKANISY